jgi:ATP-dependent Clp protease ATP-binding subunit ClpX
VDYVRYAAILTDAMYELPSSDDKTLEIDADYAKETLNNLLKRLNCV